MFFFKGITLILGVYLSAYIFYYLILLFAHFFIKEKKVGVIYGKTRFAIIIPAHNEELFIGRLLQSIKNQNYPSELAKCVVVADNCTDKTAAIALVNGIVALNRSDEINKGKGYAIRWAIENINLNEFNAVFIIDADSVIDKNLLFCLNQDILGGKNVIQCYNGVVNPDKNWFTRLLDVSRTISNEIYHPAKQKLGLSSYLMGNGMCFSTKILKKYGWEAFTVGEDWEYYARLIQEGEIIAFNNHARVYHQESSSLKQATSQRMRWSSGRFAIAWKYGLRLFYKGLIERDLKKIDASLPLILPNPSLGINITIFFFILTMLLPTENKNLFLLWPLSLMLLQFSIFIIGILYTKNRLKNFLAIFIAPLFLIWKMGVDILSAIGMGRKEWVRTERKS